VVRVGEAGGMVMGDDPRSIAAEELHGSALESALLALNNAHAVELSWLETGRLRKMIGEAFCARRIGAVSAFLLAFDQEADYDNPNFLWFRARYRRFVYIDRIVTAAGARGKGLARRLYLDLFDAARAAGHDQMVCEVNADPPNPASDAFHAALGFVAVGTGEIHGGSKTVTYLARALEPGRQQA
jgi:uncharacterized protein